MDEQASLLPKADWRELVAEAQAEHRPVATFCLFSGGNDSAGVAHLCREHYDELVWIDTGTSVPGVEEYVRETARWLDKPLRVMRHDFDAFRLLVLGGTDWKGDEFRAFGFPGPPQHGRAYNRLKQYLLERLLREAKAGHPRAARVLCLTGVRRAESKVRQKRQPQNRKGSMAFCNPLIDWTDADLLRYREANGVPESEVAALLHRSGECNCGSFAGEGEREMLAALWPAWFEARIGSLEREAEAIGAPCTRWGERCAENGASPEDVGLICQACEQLTLGGTDG